MHTRLLLISIVLSVVIAAPAAQTTPRGSIEAELQRLESGKWDPTSLGGPKELVALIADDFVSVEYGADVAGGVQRPLVPMDRVCDIDMRAATASGSRCFIRHRRQRNS